MPNAGERSVEDFLVLAEDLRRQGDLVQSSAVLSEASVLFPADARVWFQRARAKSRAMEVEAAIEDYRMAVKYAPRDFNALNNLAVSLAQLGRHADAVSVYEAAIVVHPNVALLHANLGMSLKCLGHHHRAAQSLEKAIALGDKNLSLHLDCAVAWSTAGSRERALAHYDFVLEKQPGNAIAHHNRGTVLLSLGLIPQAIAAEKQALAIQPEYAWAAFGLGNALQAALRHEEAKQAFDLALAIEPGMAAAYNNRANTLRAMHREAEALEDYERACQIAPQDATYVKSLASMLSAQGQHARAQAVLERALQKLPGNAGLHFALGMSLLASAQWAWGWFHFEWRYGTAEGFARPYKTRLPSWRPEHNVTRILVSTEWGLGDQIMFSGMLLDLTRWSLDITVMVDPRLLRLLGTAFPEVRFVSRYEEHNDVHFDAHISLASLAQFTRLKATDFEPAARGYLSADEGIANSLRKKLIGSARRMIGVSWRTSREGGAHRNIELEPLIRALNQPGVVLVSLQYGDVEEDIERAFAATGVRVIQCDCVDNKADMDGLAALIRACDAVVTVDNTTVHLAGALAAPTWVLLPHAADWRWRHEGDRSPWYDTVHLCRQSRALGWGQALEQLTASLSSKQSPPMLDV